MVECSSCCHRALTISTTVVGVVVIGGVGIGWGVVCVGTGGVRVIVTGVAVGGGSCGGYCERALV